MFINSGTEERHKSPLVRVLLIALGVYALIIIILMFYWSR